MKNRAILSLLFGFINFFAAAQSFVQIFDATGIEIPEGRQTQLEVASAAAISFLPFEIHETFKIYDAGFYIPRENTIDGYSGAWLQAINYAENDPVTDFYLVFGREIDAETFQHRIRVKLKIPNIEPFTCLAPEERQRLELKIEKQANEGLKHDFISSELSAISTFGNFLHKLLTCDCGSGSTTCSLTESFEEIDLELLSLGFRKLPVKIGGISNWSSGTQGIYDHFGRNIVIDGFEYNIPDRRCCMNG